MNDDPVRHPLQVGDVERYQFRPAQRGGEADQEEGAVALANQRVGVLRKIFPQRFRRGRSLSDLPVPSARRAPRSVAFTASEPVGLSKPPALCTAPIAATCRSMVAGFGRCRARWAT